MTISTRTVIKSYFETGDKPTQAQFSDFIDSTLFYEDTSDFGRALISASAAGSARALLGSGVVGDKMFTTITTASAQQNIGGGLVGRSIFEAITTASAINPLGVGTVGGNLFTTNTTASAQDQLGPGAVGKNIFVAITTSSAQDQLGAGAVGKRVFEAITTASAQDQLALSPAIFIIQDQKASGTSGGASLNNFNTRVLNTVVKNTISGASLATNIITLPAGTYRVWATAQAYAAGPQQLFLYNSSDSTTVLSGSSQSMGGGGNPNSEDSILFGEFTIASTKNFILRQWIRDAVADGLGAAVSAGIIEVYAQILIEKIS